MLPTRVKAPPDRPTMAHGPPGGVEETSGKGDRPWSSWREVLAVPGMPAFGLPLAVPSLCPRGPGDSLRA